MPPRRSSLAGPVEAVVDEFFDKYGMLVDFEKCLPKEGSFAEVALAEIPNPDGNILINGKWVPVAPGIMSGKPPPQYVNMRDVLVDKGASHDRQMKIQKEAAKAVAREEKKFAAELARLEAEDLNDHVPASEPGIPLIGVVQRLFWKQNFTPGPWMNEPEPEPERPTPEPWQLNLSMSTSDDEADHQDKSVPFPLTGAFGDAIEQLATLNLEDDNDQPAADNMSPQETPSAPAQPAVAESSGKSEPPPIKRGPRTKYVKPSRRTANNQGLVEPASQPSKLNKYKKQDNKAPAGFQIARDPSPDPDPIPAPGKADKANASDNGAEEEDATPMRRSNRQKRRSRKANKIASATKNMAEQDEKENIGA